MNKKLLISTLSLIFFCLSSPAQGFEIKVNLSERSYDSLFIRSFNGKDKFINSFALPYSKSVVFKNKTALVPGLYLLAGDSTVLTEFIISEAKNQKFEITLKDKETFFTNSAENSKNKEYIKHMEVFETQMQQLDNEFKKMQESGIPQYMMQVMVDSLMANAKRITQEKTAYQKKMAAETKGMLLSSIIRSAIEMLPPSQEIYQNRLRFQRYYADHYFDDYPWEDSRMVNTPLALAKFTGFANLMYQMDEVEADTFFMKALMQSKACPETYEYFCDNMEKILGSITSQYKVEGLYIKMLKDALQTKNLDKNKKIRYEYELALIDKNLAGSKVPNFNILLSNGDTTTLYDIKSDFILLFLQNPDCPTCTQARERMATFQILNDAIKNGKIKVLTLYFEENETLWRHYLKEKANPNYLNGWNYDLTIENNKLFDTRTIPYMFLLDSDKNVIKKDLLINEVELYVQQFKMAQ